MIYFIKIAILPFNILILLLLTSCGIQYIDAPPLDHGDRWKKEGFTKNEIHFQLKNCGYIEKNWDISQQEKTDKCMLLNKFIFIDSPYGKHGSMCKYDDYNKLPSCQSLKINK